MVNQVLGDLLPAAIGVALSPVPIIAVILMLATPRARTTGVAFALGWIAGLIVASVVVIVLSSGTDDPDSGASTAVSLVKIGFGLLLFAMAAKQWRSRPAEGETAPMPAWMSTLDRFSAPKAFAMGALLSGVNPKNLALVVASAASIAQADLTGGDAAVAIAVFVVIASISVAGPVLFFLVAGERATTPLATV